jgi:hypothetical protein
MKHSPRRRTLTAFAVFFPALIALLFWPNALTSAAQSPQEEEKEERILEDKMPTHLPIKVKVKNLQNEHWARDLEVEVKNTGDKPIYVVDFFILMPEIKGPDGNPVGFGFYYGPHNRRITVGMRPEPDDVPLNPGETYTFKISEREVMLWEVSEKNPHPDRPKKFRLMFSMLSFGDGTGFQDTNGTRIPVRQSLNTQCTPKEKVGSARGPSADSAPAYLRERANYLPVSFLPANFFPDKAYAATPKFAAPQTDQFCCSGSNCYREKLVLEGYNCQCGTANWVESTSCHDSEGECGRSASWNRQCRDPTGQYVYYCPVFYINPCGSLDTE